MCQTIGDIRTRRVSAKVIGDFAPYVATDRTWVIYAVQRVDLPSVIPSDEILANECEV